MTKVLYTVINVFLVSWSWAPLLHRWIKLIRARWILSNILRLSPNYYTFFSEALGSLVYFALSVIALRQNVSFELQIVCKMKKLSCDTLSIQSCYNFKWCLLLLSCQAMYTFWDAVQVTTTLSPKNFLAVGKCLKRAVSREPLKNGRIKTQNVFQ